MANETPVTLVGRLTTDPEMRFTPNGAAVVNLTIACNERKYNKQTSEFEDGTPVFWRASAWRELAERITRTLHRGDAVVAYGFVEGRTWQDKDTGKDRYGQQVQLQAIGPDLRWMEVQGVAKAQRQDQQTSQQQQGGGWNGQGNYGQPHQQPPQQAPQAQQQRPAPQQQTAGWGDAPTYDEPPPF